MCLKMECSRTHMGMRLPWISIRCQWCTTGQPRKQRFARISLDHFTKSSILGLQNFRCIFGQFDCNLFHMDDFFLRMEQRTPDRMKETGGNVDYERFYETVSQKGSKRWRLPSNRDDNAAVTQFSCFSWLETKKLSS